MFIETNSDYKIISVIKVGWKKKIAFASPRPFHALSFRIKGDATFTSGDGEYRVRANELVYVPKGCGYTLNSQIDEELYVIHFDIVGECDTSDAKIETFSPTSPLIISEMFEKMLSAWNKNQQEYKFRLLSLFYGILDNIRHQKHRTARYGGVEEILDYISREFADPTLNVEKIADKFSISTTYLRRIFKERLNTTPLKLLNERRIRYAEALLSVGLYSVKEIAVMSGYSDVKYFSSSFKKHRGISPTEAKNTPV